VVAQCLDRVLVVRTLLNPCLLAVGELRLVAYLALSDEPKGTKQTKPRKKNQTKTKLCCPLYILEVSVAPVVALHAWQSPRVLRHFDEEAAHVADSVVAEVALPTHQTLTAKAD
jgi:hypothetical protein